MKVLEVKGLKKYFSISSGLLRRQSGLVKAVDGIDFTIGPKEVLGMVGESGCGKSTAGRCVIGLIPPTEGEIFFLGKDLKTHSASEKNELRLKAQMVFQDPSASLNPRKSIGESIGEALRYHRLVKDDKELKERVALILRQVGLSPDIMSRFPHQFSGGQQQRICIGRALALNPQLIVCDEAVSALDVSVQAQILNLLEELKETHALSYLFISHDLSVVRHICDRVIVLHFGKVVESGPSEQLFENPQHPYTKKLLSSIPRDYPVIRK